MLEQAIIEKNLSVFSGPIYDQAGNLRVEEGEAMSPLQIVQMDWLVDNVVGSIPQMDQLNAEARALAEVSGVMKEEV